MLQSSDRAKKPARPNQWSCFRRCEVSECFEFNESVKLQLVGECETFKDDNSDIAGVCAVVAFVENIVPGEGTVIGIQQCDGSQVLRWNSTVGVAVDPFLEFK